jgi:MFS family permease
VFAVLRQSAFRRLFIGGSVSTLGDAISGIALTFAVLRIGGDATALGLVLAARAVPFLVFLLIGGVMADRLPRRGVMLGADAVRLVAQGTAATLVLTEAAEVWQLAVIAAVLGTAGAFFTPAATGLLPEVVAGEDLQRANALRGFTAAGAWIVGPAIGGALVAGAGAGWALGADAASYGVSAVALAGLYVAPREPGARHPFLRDLRDGWAAFTEHDWIWVIVVSLTFANFFSTGLYVLGPVVADRELGGPGAWAAILSAGSVGALIGGIVSYRITPARPLLTACWFVCLGATPLATLAIPAPTWVIALATLIAGGGALAFNTLWETTLQRHVAPDRLSRVSAYDYLGSFIANPLGYALMGPLAAATSLRTALIVAATGEGFFILLMLSRRSIRTLRA